MIEATAMSSRTRFFIAALLLTLLSALLCLGALTLLDHRLDSRAMQHFDSSIQAGVHHWTSPWLTRLMLTLTWIGSIKIFATSLTAVLIFLLLRRRHHAALLLGLTMVGAFTLNETLKLHFHRARPRVPWAIGDEHTFSFPSGHSLFSFVLYGTLSYLALRHATTLGRRISIMLPAMLLIVGIGISRIYLGMHFPSDVIAGYLTGAIWLYTVMALDTLWRTAEGRTATSSTIPNPSP